MSKKALLILVAVGIGLWLLSDINVNATITTGDPTISYRSGEG